MREHMLVFLVVGATVYGALNLYVFRWLKPAFNWTRRASLGFALFAAVMFALPIVSRMLDRADHPGLARFTGIPGYLWMLAVLWIVSFGLLAEAWNALMFFVARFRPAADKARLAPNRFITWVGLVAAVLSIWGVFEVNTLRLETIPITTTRLAPGTKPLRILQISDLHLGPFVGRRPVDRILRLAKESRPDVVVCTGDLFESGNAEMRPLVERLALLRPPFGKVAVLGNHECYVGIPRSLELLRASGFTVLRGQAARLQWGESGVLLAGVDDPTGSMIGKRGLTDEDAALPSNFMREFTILLKHQPEVSPEAAGRFDLQLSGHTHGGQIFPFHVYVWLFFPRFSGLYDLPGGAHLYASRGVGTWGPPIRVFSRPTVTLFDIRPAAPARPGQE